MSKPPIIINGTVDLIEKQIGEILCADAATTLNISTDVNDEAVIGDKFELMRDTTRPVTVTSDEGITILSVAGKTAVLNRYGGVRVTKLGDTVWWLRGDT